MSSWALSLDFGSLLSAADLSFLVSLSSLPFSFSAFIAIASGAYHGLALKNDGSIVAWGSDGYGQVTNTPSYTDFMSIAGGEDASLALRADGSIYYWGINNYNQFENTPVGTGYVAIAGGDGYSLAITPVPSAILLGTIGLTFSDWLLHKQRRKL